MGLKARERTLLYFTSLFTLISYLATQPEVWSET